MESYNKLTTVHAERMDKNIPWNEYPRPSMVRDSFFCLNGKWDFGVSSDGSEPEYKETILVPFPPESAISGIERQIEWGQYIYYRRKFILPENMVGKRTILHFGAVDTLTTVCLNGERVAYHEGGYIPFSIDITSYLLSGENTLTVKVLDTLNLDYPYGKQTKKRGGMWYTPVSGIWQTVWIEAVPERYIEKLVITPTMNDITIKVIGGEGKKKITLQGGECYEFEGDSITISPKEKHLWSPEYPYLYRFTVEAGEDRVNSYFALREIGISKVNGISRLTLNGEPYLFNGLLDQGYYPEGIFLPATSDGYRDDILAAKSCGFNMLRKHIKVEPDIFYYLCDSLGMVVFQDMVNNSSYSWLIDTALPTIGFKRLPILFRHKGEKSRRIFEETMNETINLLYSHPSVLYYTIFNEGWGQFSADKMYDKAKALDPTRIYDATSGWFYRSRSDVESRHVYFKPVRLGRPDGRPLIISEFGGYSHRVKGHLFGKDEYGYGGFETREEYEDAFRKLYTEQVKPLISKGICGLVYTQVSDVEDETNGILTYDRRVLKLDPERTSSLMDELYAEIK